MAGFKDVINNLDTMSVRDLAKILRECMANDFDEVIRTLQENREKILGLVQSIIPKCSLGDLGVLLYTIHIANADIYEDLVDILIMYKSQIIDKIPRTEMLEIGEFLGGISHSEKCLVLINPIVEIIRNRIGTYDIHKISEFITYLSVAKKQVAMHILTQILSEIEASFSRSFPDVSLNDIALFISSIGKINRKEGIRILEKYNEKISSLFARKLESLSTDDIASFLLLMAQLDISYVEELLSKYQNEIEAVCGESAKTIVSFIDKIKEI